MRCSDSVLGWRAYASLIYRRGVREGMERWNVESGVRNGGG
ncbi:MAG: hypothetical protein OCU24_06305 [Candidatus Methanospirare jalkutatii]|nr:hypothetical protein [Candidatus Methanospirare jalkutatii]